ncbi:MAG: molybdenum cofactor guanylyltransferase [Anaerolineales bacterium]|jgi:molybdopterin-guanine dinucleotide biosynthesis protein A
MVKLSVVIQAGGKSTRMGEDKALIPFVRDTTLIQYILNQIEGLGDERLIISNDVDKFKFLGLPVFPDVYPQVGSLGGIYSAVHHARYNHCLILACDMPFVNISLIDYMLTQMDDFDIIMPRWEPEDYTEPFRAIYSKACLDPISKAIEIGERRIISFFKYVKIRFIDADEISKFDPEGLTFFNINTPDELEQARRLEIIMREDQ